MNGWVYNSWYRATESLLSVLVDLRAISDVTDLAISEDDIGKLVVKFDKFFLSDDEKDNDE